MEAIKFGEKPGGSDATIEQIIPLNVNHGASDRPTPTATADSEPYSIFTARERTLIMSLVSLAATFSTLSSFIFFPAIDALSDSLHVSVAQINLTVTSYMVVSGVAPTLLAGLADHLGRRAVFLGMMLVYCGANVGLALQRDWAALLVLRMLQSAGCSAFVALGYGVVSDITTRAERGASVSILVLGPNLASAVGPIIGGALAEYPGWQWIFWLLVSMSGACLVLLVLAFPETARSVVGNGGSSGSETGLFGSILCRPLLMSSPGRGGTDSPLSPPSPRSSQGQLSNMEGSDESGSSGSDDDSTKIGGTGTGQASAQDEEKGRPKPATKSFPNPLHSLRLLFTKDSASIAIIYGIFYMNASCIQASTSTLFIDVYGISELQAGLVYLPSGVGSVLGSYGAGPIMDYDYRVASRRQGGEAENGDDSSSDDGTSDVDFPIEKARFRSIWYVIVGSSICMIGYGWAMQTRVHISIPLVLHFIMGLTTSAIFNMAGTLLVDLHPKSPSSAQAANSLVRALLAGAGTAVVQVLIRNVGEGWTFTLFGGLGAVALGVAWLEWKYGSVWRGELKARGLER